MKRFFAQFFGFRFICPLCHELNTYRRGRRNAGAKGFNRITGVVECQHCKKKFCTGLLLYLVAPGAAKGGHPDQTPTLKELQLIRDDQEAYEAEHQGRLIPVKKKRKDLVNQYHATKPTDDKLTGD